MPPLAIQRMNLAVPGLSEAEARDLAQRVAAGLAAATGLPDGAAIPMIRLDLPPGAPGDVAGLARQIVVATLRAIGRAAAGPS